MKNPKCPYCGAEMKYYWDNNPMKPEGWFFCPKCHSRAPTAKTDDEAYAAAMKRERAKGKWGKPTWERDYLDRPIITGSACSICHKVSEYQTRYCPNCGAEMREEANDER